MGWPRAPGSVEKTVAGVFYCFRVTKWLIHTFEGCFNRRLCRHVSLVKHVETCWALISNVGDIPGRGCRAFYRSRFVGNKKCHKQLQSDWGCFFFSHENGDDLGIMKLALPHKKNHEIWWEFTMIFIKLNQQFWLPTFSIDKNVTMVPIQNMIVGAAKTDNGIPLKPNKTQKIHMTPHKNPLNPHQIL